MGKVINVLDEKGYVKLVDSYGDDLMVVNNARVSFDKQSEELSYKDKRLIAYLARERHMSPFRAPRLTFEIYAPLMIARQWWRYAVDSSHIEEGTPWNESSRRYITEDEEFYIPSAGEWRSYPDKSIKQGSGEPIPEGDGEYFSEELEAYITRGENLYARAMDLGVAPEQARLFLPAYGMYVRWRWTPSLETTAHVIKQRTADDAQYEFRLYAKAVCELASDKFPVSLEALIGGGE